jgi:hypothetical protein
MFQFANNENQKKRHSEQSEESSQFNNIHTERPQFCIHCGARLEDENDFCTECGAKIELEVFESEESKENQSKVPEQKSPVPVISSDRMASIAETNARKVGQNAGNLKKFQQCAWTEKGLAIQNKTTSAKNKLINKMYVHKDSAITMYLKILDINGDRIQASIKSIFENGSYATENYTGTLNGEEISLNIVDYDLHPLPDETQTSYSETSTQILVCRSITSHEILVGDSFSGIVSEDTIAGTFSGEFSGFCVFNRV